jgi:DNA-binding PucR family transcriptional regulator
MLNARDDASRGEDDLIADLLATREVPPGEIVRRARQRGCDLTAGFLALCVNPGEASAGWVVATVAVERPDALVEPRGARVHILLPGETEGATMLAARLAERIGASAHSSRYRQATDARAALEEAELLLKLVEAGGRTSSDRPTWDSLRLLFRAFVADPQELARFAEQTVGAVVRHDERHGSELEVTFWAYQEANCNMNLTAKATFTHRHTISNRLTRIEELTGLDPVRNYDRELLSLAFKAHIVVTMAPPR